jgi:hypothetical protein
MIGYVGFSFYSISLTFFLFRYCCALTKPISMPKMMAAARSEMNVTFKKRPKVSW